MRSVTHFDAGGSHKHAPLPERFLLALGTDPAVAEAVIGDLTEEYASRRARRGDTIARAWLLHEVVRSFPSFLWTAIRHGTPAVRVRIAGVVAGVALVITAVAFSLLSRSGPPARLVTDVADGTDGIIVNNVDPVQLEVRALDAHGRRVSSQGLRFQWASGIPALISPAGGLTCTHDGDLIVRASLGGVTTDVGVTCRRVRMMYASSWIDLVAGGAARPLPYVAVGVDGQRVQEVRGRAVVLDSSVATVVGTSMRGRAVGRTYVDVFAGDSRAQILVTVHEPVRGLDALREDQRYVAVPMRLAHGDTIRLSLPREAFWLAYLPRRPGDAPPTILLDGQVTCSHGDVIHQYLTPLDEPRMYCTAHARGAVVMLAHGMIGAPVVEGSLLFERVDQWRVPQ
jgi:hypothetical protein